MTTDTRIKKKTLWKKVICLLLLILLAVGAIGICFALKSGDNENNKAKQNLFNRNAVVANGDECAGIGMNILRNHNGTAADAAIATLFCEGVTCTQSMGLGGGFIMTIFDKSTNTIETLISRERAPLASHAKMFVNVTGDVSGILSVAVPGELKGYWEIHQKYGRVPWKTLVQPTIDLCKNGHLVTNYLGKVLKTYEKTIYNSTSLSEVFVNSKTRKIWQAGDRIKRPQLANTLEIIANEGVDSMYSANGSLVRVLVDEIQKLGGIITIEDFVQYTVEWKKPVVTTIRNNLRVYSAPLPSTGMVLSLILNIMNGYKPENSNTYLHRLIESYKFAYGKRTKLGDVEMNATFLSQFNDLQYADHIRSLIWDNQTFNDHKHYGGEFANAEDHGTAQMSVLAENGDALSVTSTINNIFGSKIRSEATGIILNDEMDDFATPGKPNLFGIHPSPANFIQPRKRPLSSMAPSIVLNENNDVILLIGAAGGSRITTSIAYSLIRHLWLNETLKHAIDARRLHHQLMPMQINYEDGFAAEAIQALEALGHRTKEEATQIGFSSVTAISRFRGFVEAVPDSRRHGSSAIF